MSARRIFVKNSPQAINACGDVAQQERFELSSRVSGYTISSRARYDHFDTTPSTAVRVSETAKCIIPAFPI